MNERVDVIVLGMGVGGESVGGSLAQAGLDVVGIENRLVGGECPYWGCIPSKMIVRAADLLAEAERVNGMAGSAEARPDWKPVATRIRDEATTNWDDQVAADRFTDLGGRLVRGTGRLTGPHHVEVDGTTYEATRAVVIGAGTAPMIPPIDGLGATPYWTNREALEAAEPPESLIVLGGGAIGLELAQGFARFGVDVTVVEMQDRLVAIEEPEASEVARRAMQADGIEVHLGNSAQSVRHDGSVFTLTLGDGTQLRAQQLLVSVGRRSDLAGLGVEAIGVDPERKSLPVDDRLRVTDGVWAVGDITGKGAFTHVATYQADIVTREILGQDGPLADYRAVPRVTFTDPEIGAVGLTEAQAREAGITVQVGVAEVPSTTRGWIHKAGNDGVIKLVADADRGVLIGATSAGPTGGEVLGALAVAVRGQVPVDTLRHMIYAYPTIHRGILDALIELS